MITLRDSNAMNTALNAITAHVEAERENVPCLLLVDDEPRLLWSLHALLSGRSYRLVTATCGREAIEQMERHSFDLVLLDLRLPDLSGHELMDHMQERNISASVIVLSGDTGIDAAIGALKRGAYGYLRKPYSQEELLRTVDNALQKKRLESENREIAWKLECSEKLYRYLVDSSPDIIYTLGADGYFTFVNDRIHQLLGIKREELIGKHYSFIVHDDDLELARYVFNERRIGDRASRNVELRLKSFYRPGDQRVYEHTVRTISFNSMGMYQADQDTRHRKFFGTYGVARDITERKRAQEQISYQAYHDILTDLPNRILFRDRLSLAMIQAARDQTGLAVMFLDLDRFKLVNDTLGHVKGDELLQQVAARLKGVLRRGDTLARIGGDEFTVLLPELRDRQDAALIADKFLKCLEEAFHLDGHELYISASIGIALYPEDGENMDDLVRHADIAMYQMKSIGKNGYSFYDRSMLDASEQKVLLENSLRKALENGELEMYYQPMIDIRTRKVIGAEGLMRWNHPVRGVLSAGEFLPFAEENGLMMPISEWMITALCRDVSEWNRLGRDRIRLSLNISPQCLDRGNFASKLKEGFTEFGIPASQIEVEITENICIRKPQAAIEQLRRLRDLGVSIAIDDFGTGYSSLSYLHRFPVHTIKIDQSFIREIGSETGHYPVVLAIISIASGLGLHVVAEGVETEAQASYLERAGCTTMQGYLFHTPFTHRQLMQTLLAQEPEQMDRCA